MLFDKRHIIAVGDFVKLYSSIKDKDSIGSWKNALDSNINKVYKNGFDYIETNDAWKICEAIYYSKLLIDKNDDFKIADLIIQFLLYYNYSFEQVSLVIKTINKESNEKNITKANIYRKNSVINTIRDTLSVLHIDNLFDVD